LNDSIVEWFIGNIGNCFVIANNANSEQACMNAPVGAPVRLWVILALLAMCFQSLPVDVSAQPFPP
jgi:hypothetical protein